MASGFARAGSATARRDLRNDLKNGAEGRRTSIHGLRVAAAVKESGSSPRRPRTRLGPLDPIVG